MKIETNNQFLEILSNNSHLVKWIMIAIGILFVSLNAKGTNKLNTVINTEISISSEIKYDVAISNPIISYNVSPHNLYTIGAADQELDMQTGKCIFCHSQTNKTNNTVLWDGTNKKDSFTSDNNHTAMLSIGSLKCLSCHDGVTAGNNLPNGFADFIPAVAITSSNSYAGAETALYSGGYLSGDMGNNHPVGIVYDEGNPGLNAIADLRIAKLETGTNKVTCASCHEPHSTTNGSFLAVSNVGSSLCLDCHNK